MRITDLRTNHLKNPQGYIFNELLFTWKVDDTRAKTDKYTHIIIATDSEFINIVYDSGKIDNLGTASFSPKIELVNETRYYWKVSVETTLEEEASAIAWFETGLEGEWCAKWLRVSSKVASEAMPIFYKDIDIEKDVRKAVIYSCGYGLYEGYANGEKIGNEYLMPGYYSYDLVTHYQTNDITDLLHKGKNDISFIMGNGWYKGRFVFEGGFTNLYGDYHMMSAIIKLEFNDGSTEIIITDDSWNATESHILDNNIYDGEVIDMNHETKMLEMEICPPPANIMARTNPPLVITDTKEPQKIIFTPKGEIVLDFGESITGWVEFDANTDEEIFVTLEYGELLQEGNFYNENLRTAKAEFVYKGIGNNGFIRPHFSYYGFRYVKVTGLRHIKADMFRACRIMSEVDTNGKLYTVDTDVNKLIQNALRSQKCNFIDIPIDCPQRDERMGWTGDIAVFAQTSLYQMDCVSFLSNYMKHLAMEQEKLGGAVPFFVPKPKLEPYEGINPFLVTAGACVWGDAATMVPWEMYLHTKDKSVLAEFYDVMRSWVDYIESRTKENKVPYLWQNDRQLGDWLALDNGNINNPIGRTDAGLIASAYYYNSVTICQKAAKVLEDRSEEARLSVLAQNIRSSFIKEFFNSDGTLNSEKTQTAYSLIICFGLYEKSNMQTIKKEFKDSLAEYDFHLSTGFAGTRFLLPALSEIGLNDLAYRLLLNRDYPGWLREVRLGATTIWERWNSLNDDGTISGTGMNSLNHYAYGCVVGWIYQYVCGFTWDEDNEMILRPMPDKELQFIASEYDSVCMNWKYIDSKTVEYEVAVPFQKKVKLYLPDGSMHNLETGKYVFLI